MARILVADDNALSLAFFTESISRYGHVVDAAEDGMQACLLASAQGYDLMILDSRMPRRDGSETLRVIRTGRGPSCNAVAIVTTADDGVDRGLLLEAGFCAVMTKPIALEALGILLESHLLLPARQEELLNDHQALTQIGGNESIMAALRSLLASELDTLPDEIGVYTAGNDLEALRDRLHRLDASAGFCGASRLARATRELRRALDASEEWPAVAIMALLEASAETRALLG